MKTLTVDNHPDLLKDAVTLLKSDFVALYVSLGHSIQDAGMAWHSLRTSAQGHELRKKLVPSYLGNQATSFISDVEEEAKIRMGKKVKKKAVVEVDEQVAVAEQPKGNKEERAKSLIESGVKKASELSKQGGFSVPYAYMMLKKYGK